MNDKKMLTAKEVGLRIKERSIKCQDKMYKKYGIRMYINLLVECGFATGKIFLIL